MTTTTRSRTRFRSWQFEKAEEDVTQAIILANGDPDYDIYSDIDPIFRARQWGASGVIEGGSGRLAVPERPVYRPGGRA